MRVISGEFKNRRLHAPKDMSIRPTMDRSKEALFSILGPNLYGCSFLDLFAGCGSIGIEALSRGAGNVVCVDNNINSIKIIKHNNALINNKLHIVKQDALRYLEQTSNTWDFIFLDPPYDIDLDYITKIVTYIKNHKLVNPGGQIIVELASHSCFNDPDILQIRKYGASQFYFIKGD